MAMFCCKLYAESNSERNNFENRTYHSRHILCYYQSTVINSIVELHVFFSDSHCTCMTIAQCVIGRDDQFPQRIK